MLIAVSSPSGKKIVDEVPVNLFPFG